MRWLRKSAVVLAVVLSWAGLPSVSQAGWITLMSGQSGNVQPTDASEFWYGAHSTPPLVAIDTVSGSGTVQAVTGGGISFFNSLGVPVLLNLTDGSAYLAGGSPPSGVTASGPGGTSAGTPASAAPLAGVPIPPDYTHLNIALTTSDAGAQVLTASVLDGSSAALGSGSVVVPEGGWWVLGLGPDQQPTPEPLPEPTPTPTPEPVPTPTPSPAPGVPEPATVALAASGVILVLPWLRRNRRASAK